MRVANERTTKMSWRCTKCHMCAAAVAITWLLEDSLQSRIPLPLNARNWPDHACSRHSHVRPGVTRIQCCPCPLRTRWRKLDILYVPTTHDQIYVYTYVRIFVCMCGRVHVCTSICLSACLPSCLSLSHVRMTECMYATAVKPHIVYRATLSSFDMRRHKAISFWVASG